MSELPNKRIDGEIDEITTHRFKTMMRLMICWQICMKISAALMPTKLIDHTMK